MNKKRINTSFIIFLVFLVVSCGILTNQLFKNVKFPSIGGKKGETTEISIIYAPESETYLKDAIQDFNNSYNKGINPVTGNKLKNDEKRIKVTGKNESSGTARTEIVNAINKAGTSQVAQPTIFAPSVSHWLSLVNLETNKEVFKLNEAVPTANAPVVIAIWESRLNAIKAKNPGKEIGWQELLQVINSPNGWADYSPSITRKSVYYGHTDPFVSSTALSTLISEYYASAKYLPENPNLEQLTISNVNDPKVKDGVKNIEKLIKHYSSRTTEFKEYIAQGPNYLDFVALEENDLIFINQGKTEYKPPEKLVALYPKEGTFIHEHPFAVPNADWVSDDQRAAAKVFTDYILTDKIQKKVLENGFRPASKNINIDNPITAQYGVDPAQPKVILNTPSADVISGVQLNWNFVKKRSQVYMLLDSSGSMDGEPMRNAKDALRVFSDKLPSDNAIGLVSFSDSVRENVPLGPLESNRSRISSGINEITANGSTALYDGLLQTIDKLNTNKENPDAIKAIILLSDGKDTSSKNSLSDVVTKLQDLQKSDNPIFVIPIAYGPDADQNALNAIARSSSTRVQYGNAKDINKLLEVISSYF